MDNQKVEFKNTIKKGQNPFFSATFTYLVVMFLFVCVRIAAYFDMFGALGEYANLAYSVLIQIGLIFGVSFLLYKTLTKKKAKQIFKDFNFHKLSLKGILISIGLGICILFINIAINSVYVWILSWVGYTPSSGTPITSYALSTFLIAIFASAVLPAFCEEFANRGMLLFGFKKLGYKKAIILSGLLFGLMHLNIAQFGYAFVIGMFLGFLCIATGSIIPGMIIHFMNNALNEYITFANVNGLFLGDFYSKLDNLISGDNFISSILIIFFLILIVVFFFCWLTYLLIKDTRKKKIQDLSKDLTKTLKEEKQTSPQTFRIDIPMSALGFQAKQTYFPTLKQNIPLYTAIFLSSVITIMTLIWNVI